MKAPERQTKLKVIIGYTLLFIFTISAIVFIYKKIQSLNSDESLISNANRKLFIIGNTITGLYEAEALSHSFLQTGSKSSFSKYINIIRQVEANIDSLRNMTTETSQKNRIDTIHQLLNSKIRNLKELIRVKKQQSAENYYTQAIALITSAKDSVADKPDIRKRIITTYDTTYVKEKKRKGFLGIFSSRERDSSLKVTVSNHVLWDTLHDHSGATNADSIVNILKSTWENYQTKTENLNRQISQKEYHIVQQSVRITEQLKQVLSAYEMEEINHSLFRMQQREQVMNSTAGLIAKIAILAVLLIAFFCTLILKDISKSQRYQKQLETAKSYTDHLLKSKEKLILTVTHDIKSPLGSILGYIELLNTTSIDKRQRYYLENMKGSSEHILHLATDLLDYSKLENNKMSVEEVVFNPRRLLEEICISFIPLAKAKNLQLDYDISNNLNQHFKGDILRIRQILSNLLSNGIKYTQQGSVHMEASYSVSGHQLTLRIQDTGPGMTPEEQQTVFEEFTRLSSNSDIAEGTGLGLTITLKLIELLQGKITLESQPGKGSCFTIILPLKPTDNVESVSPAPSLPALVPSSSALKILLIDDDPLQLEMTAGLLKKSGHQTETTTQPAEAIKKIKSHKYDIVFTDIQMPDTDGFEVIRQIRKLPAPFAATLPVIALSADSGKTKEEYLKAGFTAYLGKPFTSAQLLQLIGLLTHKTFLPSSKSLSSSFQPENTQTFTLKNIRQFTDNDPEAIRQILQSFQAETEKHLALLTAYVSSEKWEKTAHLAHKMLPMFRQLEAQDIIPLLAYLEHPDTPHTEKDFRKKTEAMIPLIRELLSQLGNSKNHLS